MRLALGAGRGRLIRQTLTEGLVLAAAGAAFGLALASVLSRAILRFLETDGNRVSLDLTPDWRILGFTAAVTCLTCVLLSVAPAIRAASGQAAEAMKASARGLTTDRSRFGFQRLLVVIQVSISLILVAGAFLICRELPPAGHDGPWLPRGRRVAGDASSWANRSMMKRCCGSCSPKCVPHHRWSLPPRLQISSLEAGCGA